MGAADTVTSIHERKYRVCVNSTICSTGSQGPSWSPAQLQELDTTEIALPFGAQYEDELQEDAVQKYRDVLKSAVIKEDGGPLISCWESNRRTSIMRCRSNAVYDALNTANGGRCCEKASPGGCEFKRPTAGADTSQGSIKTTRLTPNHHTPIASALWRERMEWAAVAPRMMNVKNKLLRFRAGLSDPSHRPGKTQRGELAKLSTSLREVMGYIKYSG